MDDTSEAPPSLKVVAMLYIAGGIISLIEFLAYLLTGDLYLPVGVLSLFIGSGLLQRSRGWRTCALVFQWIAMIATPIIGVLFLVSSEPLEFEVFWQRVGHVPKEVGVVLAGLLFVLEVWIYRVLTRPDVRRLFGVGVRASSPDRVMG